jgi:hypothetical protein
MPKTKNHLVVSASPVIRGSSCTAVCGEPIKKCAWSFGFDALEMSEWRIQVAKLIGLCSACKRGIVDEPEPEGRFYVTGVREAKEEVDD